MDLGEIIRVIGKRWYIMLPLMLVTIALTVGVYLMVPAKYQSTSEISLLNAQKPATTLQPAQSNPFLTFDSSLTATADFLARSVTSDASVKQLKALGITEIYTAALADNAQGPFVAFTVTGDDKAHVFASTKTLTAFASQRLQDIQQSNGVKPADEIHTAVIIPPQVPLAQMKTKAEAVIGIGAVGTVAAFLGTFVTESLSRSRQRGKPGVPLQTLNVGLGSDQTAIIDRPKDPEIAASGGRNGRSPGGRELPKVPDRPVEATTELILSGYPERGTRSSRNNGTRTERGTGGTAGTGSSKAPAGNASASTSQQQSGSAALYRSTASGRHEDDDFISGH